MKLCQDYSERYLRRATCDNKMENHSVVDSHFEMKYAFHQSQIYICGIRVNQSIIDDINNRSISGMIFNETDFLICIIKQIIDFTPKNTTVVLYKFHNFIELCNYFNNKIGYLYCPTSETDKYNILIGRPIQLIILERIAKKDEKKDAEQISV